MFWADKIAKTIIDSGAYKPYWVDDMKTPSGRIHVGSLRGMLIHELVWRSLIDSGKDATFTWVFDDQDPMDDLPKYLEKETWNKYLGQPLFTIPAPDTKAKNYGVYFAQEFIDVFHKLGCQPTIIWGSELYKAGKMNDYVRLCLDKASIIRNIYEQMYKKKLPADWYPFQIICPKCGKESTTKVTAWDGINVTFSCNIDGVLWTKGCGYKGKASPFSRDGKFVGKLPWKVEWPVKWKAIGVTIEGAGKDHMSAGGSHDIAKQICEKVLDYPVPYPIAYEFFLVGGKKMSSSKGLGASAKEISEMMPPYLLRFLFTRTDYKQAIEFDPVGTMAIPDLFDEYDRCWQAYIDGSDENLSRAFELSQIGQLPEKKKLFIPRFKDIANYIQQNVDIHKKFEEIKEKLLTEEEAKILYERKNYAYLWIGKYAPKEYQLSLSEALPSQVRDLTELQKRFLSKIIPLLDKNFSANDLNLALYNLAEEMQIDTKQAFAAIYMIFIGKTYGPRAAWFLLQYPKEKVIARLKEAVEAR